MKKIKVISRHAGAISWLASQGWVGEVIPYLDLTTVKSHDVIVGVLPIHLAAEVCGKGAEYWHLGLIVPPQLRGVELSAEQITLLQPTLTRFNVTKGCKWTCRGSTK